MKTTNKNANTAIENGFKIIRKGTKHRNDFVRNEFVRPMTIATLFQILAHQGIEKSMYEIHNLIVTGNYATDYHSNNKSTVHLVVTDGYAVIEFKNASYNDITLSFEKLCDMYSWLGDRSIYSTDFK